MEKMELDYEKDLLTSRFTSKARLSKYLKSGDKITDLSQEEEQDKGIQNS